MLKNKQASKHKTTETQEESLMAFQLTFPPPSSSVSLLKMAACVPSVGAWFWRKQNRPCSQRTVFVLTCLEGPGRTDARVLPLFHPTQGSKKDTHRGCFSKTLKVNEHAAAWAKDNSWDKQQAQS